METLSGFPFTRLSFNDRGKLIVPPGGKELLEHLAQGKTTDLVVISHGWRNDAKDAQKLYRDFLASARAGFASEGVPTAGFAVAGVFWPSMALNENDPISGSAAGVKASDAQRLVKEALDQLGGLAADAKTKKAVAKCRSLIPKLEKDPKAQEQFVKQLLSLLPTKGEAEEGVAKVHKAKPRELLKKLSPKIVHVGKKKGGGGIASAGGPGTSGGVAGFGSFLEGLLGGAARLVNYTTYYTMKERAGDVGLKGLNPLLLKVQAQHPSLRIHLVGHSFGGRLVSAAALGETPGAGSRPLEVSTMSLLQAAFSHFGFSNDVAGKGGKGFFRKVVEKKRVTGPILVTRSQNDKAVGVMYAIASRLSGVNAAALGDEKDEYGGIGRNGAQGTPESDFAAMTPAGPFAWKKGRLLNLEGTKFIADHGSVTGPEIGRAFASAVRFVR